MSILTSLSHAQRRYDMPQDSQAPYTTVIAPLSQPTQVPRVFQQPQAAQTSRLANVFETPQVSASDLVSRHVSPDLAIEMEKAARIEAVERLIDYEFQDPTLMWEALQSAGSVKNTPRLLAMPEEERILRIERNKRLAILGEVVLQACLAEDWYKSRSTTGMPVLLCLRIRVPLNSGDKL